MSTKISVPNVQLTTASSGTKYQGRDDVLLVDLPTGSTMAGVFTKSKCPSAPVDWCKEIVRTPSARGIIVNAGNANAFTGVQGAKTVEEIITGAANVIGCDNNQIYISSTGVIGEPLDGKKIVHALTNRTNATIEQAAKAIMTTDTFAKWHCVEKNGIIVSGIAKGSGMIEPNMATMLGYIFTNIKLEKTALQNHLSQSTDQSFNCITVDSDTSTSDTVLLASTNDVVGNENIFKELLDEVCTSLAHQIVRDGEGASKFITINVTGAQNNTAAKTIAKTIANSPLVKTAIAGEDPNWGRIIAAVGKAGEKADRDKIMVKIGGFLITENGQLIKNYDEKPVAQYMKNDRIEISADVGIDNGAATVWTCDLTHQYITINADYRS